MKTIFKGTEVYRTLRIDMNFVDEFKELGINYKSLRAEPIGDCFIAERCTNIPNELPDYVTIIKKTNYDYITDEIFKDVMGVYPDYIDEITEIIHYEDKEISLRDFVMKFKRHYEDVYELSRVIV